MMGIRYSNSNPTKMATHGALRQWLTSQSKCASQGKAKIRSFDLAKCGVRTVMCLAQISLSTGVR